MRSSESHIYSRRDILKAAAAAFGGLALAQLACNPNEHTLPRGGQQNEQVNPQPFPPRTERPREPQQLLIAWHTVQEGETLWSITQNPTHVSNAEGLGCTLDVEEIRVANHLGPSALIRPGDKIKIVCYKK